MNLGVGGDTDPMLKKKKLIYKNLESWFCGCHSSVKIQKDRHTTCSLFWTCVAMQSSASSRTREPRAPKVSEVPLGAKRTPEHPGGAAPASRTLSLLPRWQRT